MHSTSLLPLLSTRVASMLQTSNTLEGSRVMLALSSFLRGWSDLHDKASGLPISHPGWWQREKLKHERKTDKCACEQEVGKVLMVHEDLKLLCCTFKEEAPLV